MKKHNGHSQHSVPSKARNVVASSRKATVVKNVARAPTRQRVGHSPVPVRVRKSSRDDIADIANAGDDMDLQSIGTLAPLDDAFIKVLGFEVASATGSRSMAIGSGAQATGTQSVALGAFSGALNANGVAIGFKSDASGDRTTAIGSGASAAADYSVALGRQAIASVANAVALGVNSLADRADTVSVGSAATDGSGFTRKIVNMDAGVISSTSTDAVNGSQLYALQNGLRDSGVYDPDTGVSLAVTYSNATKSIISLGDLGMPVGVMNVAAGVAGSDAVNVDQLNGAIDSLSIDLSASLKYVKVNSTGPDAGAAGLNAVAIGPAASARGPYAVAIGSAAIALWSTSVAIGTDSRASGPNSVAIGVNSLADGADTVSVGNIGHERKIVNVDDGDITAGSTDAINGGQLFLALGALQETVAAMRAQMQSLQGAIAAMQTEMPLSQRHPGQRDEHPVAP
ncbi:hypothetical protein DWU98_21170 [Dyella monticola]|uniref:Peptidase S74 domain-containing protein n=1 Tax=Dyella monticola TaxID=1927958 RepID=A0A370WRH6_9GAMM|nr:hypothetical protein [Dyella monticola]RDS78779.1 hypothetical protein DWU98_21170 [Dyella monticola]